MINKRNNRRVASVTRLRKKRQIMKRYRRIQSISGCALAASIVAVVITIVTRLNADYRHHAQEKEIKQTKEETITQDIEKDFRMPTAGVATVFQEMLERYFQYVDNNGAEISMLPEYAALYEQNSDIIGWLRIDDTVIDYPVMQTMEDEDYYLSYDFNEEANNNGCLIMDTDSVVGVGTIGNQHEGGEKREYELIAVFYSQVYMNTDEVFKYYQFFQANTEEEFDDWYKNIKSMSLYNTGTSAEFGDEFITLSCCSYHVEDGRFVIVAKRIV